MTYPLTRHHIRRILGCYYGNILFLLAQLLPSKFIFLIFLSTECINISLLPFILPALFFGLVPIDRTVFHNTLFMQTTLTTLKQRYNKSIHFLTPLQGRSYSKCSTPPIQETSGQEFQTWGMEYLLTSAV